MPTPRASEGKLWLMASVFVCAVFFTVMILLALVWEAGLWAIEMVSALMGWPVPL
jgi:hypothetical protein